MLKKIAELLLLFCFSTSNAFHAILVPKKDLILLSLNEPEISTDSESSQQVLSYEEGREPYLEVDLEAYFDGVKPDSSWKLASQVRNDDRASSLRLPPKPLSLDFN